MVYAEQDAHLVLDMLELLLAEDLRGKTGGGGGETIEKAHVSARGA